MEFETKRIILLIYPDIITVVSQFYLHSSKTSLIMVNCNAMRFHFTLPS